jgi:hypothetical protein
MIHLIITLEKIGTLAPCVRIVVASDGLFSPDLPAIQFFSPSGGSKDL